MKSGVVWREDSGGRVEEGGVGDVRQTDGAWGEIKTMVEHPDRGGLLNKGLNFISKRFHDQI